MATLQIRIDDSLKATAESLFNSLGLDMSTAVKVFLSAAIENDGIPFPIRHKRPNAKLREALENARLERDLIGPFAPAEEAVRAMLED